MPFIKIHPCSKCEFRELTGCFIQDISSRIQLCCSIQRNHTFAICIAGHPGSTSWERERTLGYFKIQRATKIRISYQINQIIASLQTFSKDTASFIETGTDIRTIDKLFGICQFGSFKSCIHRDIHLCLYCRFCNIRTSKIGAIVRRERHKLHFIRCVWCICCLCYTEQIDSYIIQTTALFVFAGISQRMNKQIVVSNAIIVVTSQNGCCKCLRTSLSHYISSQYIIGSIDIRVTDLHRLDSNNRFFRPDIHHSQRTFQGQFNRSTCLNIFLHSTESIFGCCVQSPFSCIHRHVLQIGSDVEFIIYIIQICIVPPTAYVVSPS